MEKNMSSTMTSNHIFKLSGYSLDLDLLVWLTDFPFPVTLGHEALWGFRNLLGWGYRFPALPGPQIQNGMGVGVFRHLLP